MEKEMAIHSSVLAWRIPGTGEPGGLPSMGLHRVGHDCSDLAAAAAAPADTQGKRHVITENETEVMWLQIKEYPGLTAMARRHKEAGKDSPLEP